MCLDVSKAVIWGGEVNGDECVVSALLPKVLALMTVTIQVAMLGYAAAGLVQTMAGSWVAVFMFRRRWLCCINRCYSEIRGCSKTDIMFRRWWRW